MEKLLKIIRKSGIDELKQLESLNILNGDYINLECKLPNGKTGKILDDNKKYYAAEVCIKNSDKCYGVAACDEFIAVYRYGNGGADAELVLWRSCD